MERDLHTYPEARPVAVPLISPCLIAPAVFLPVDAKLPETPPAVELTFLAVLEAVEVAPFAASPPVLVTPDAV